MQHLNLRGDLQALYRDALLNDRSTITAGPFFSLKSATVKAVIENNRFAVLHDLRQGLPGDLAKHIFLDSIEVIAYEELQKLIFYLRDHGSCVHLITHLYYYETVKAAIPGARPLFPQLLTAADQAALRNIFNDLPPAEKNLGLLFIDYADGWPGVVKTLDTPERLKLLRTGFNAFNNSISGTDPIAFFKTAARAYFQVYQDFLEKNQAVDKNLAAMQITIPGATWSRFARHEIDLPELVKSIDPALWHYVKYGLFWLDEEKQELRVPRIIRGMLS